MATSTKPHSQTLYYGTFVHNTSLAKFEVLENTVIGVEDGKIAFIEKNIMKGNVEWIAGQHGWDNLEITWCDGPGTTFWFPGFIGG